MIHHSSIAVRDFEKSRDFYDATFAKLHYTRVMTIPEMNLAGYGIEGGPPGLWIGQWPHHLGDSNEEIGNARGVHFGFLAPNASCVDEWYEACLAAGGTCNGKPGVRPQYHPGYYGAFTVDPDGWRIEACFHNHR